MKKYYIWAILIIMGLSLGIMLNGCGGSASGGGGGGGATIRSYNSAASIGDYITYTINESDKTWTYTNITSPETLTGTYDVNADGTYTAYVSGTNESFKVIELPNIAVITPVKATGGKTMIMAGTLKGSFSQSDLLGKYVFVDFCLGGWGTYEVKADNTLNYWEYSVSTPEFTLITSETGIAYVYNSDGTITFPGWPTCRTMISPSGVMVIDNGPGLGMTIGVKQPSSISTPEGMFNCMDELAGYVGYITFESLSNVTWDFGSASGGGTISHMSNAPGVFRYTETTSLECPAVIVTLPGQFFAGVEKVSTTEYGGFIGANIQ